LQPRPSSDSARKARTSSSSSMTSTRAPPPPAAEPASRLARFARAGASAAGSKMWTVAPRPLGSRSAGSRPPAGDAVDLGEAEAGALAERLGREEGLVARASTSAPCPGRCRRRRRGHSRPAGGRALPSGSGGSVEMVSVPPSGIASRALMARLRIAFSSWLASQSRGRPAGRAGSRSRSRRRSCGGAGAASPRSPR
jgi:hypothetical protein